MLYEGINTKLKLSCHLPILCLKTSSKCRNLTKSCLKAKKKKALTVLCSAVKHLGRGYIAQEVGRNTLLCHACLFISILILCSSLFRVCFTTEQSTVKASSFVKLNAVSVIARFMPKVL